LENCKKMLSRLYPAQSWRCSTGIIKYQ